MYVCLFVCCMYVTLRALLERKVHSRAESHCKRGRYVIVWVSLSIFKLFLSSLVAKIKR